MKFSKLDNTLIGFFVFIFISSIYLLMTQDRLVVSLKPATSIGIIKEIKNTVKKRNISMMTWHNTVEADTVQEDDIIFTNNKSSVLLTFNDGTILNIEEDSLIRLKNFKDTYGIVLEKGQIQINNQKNINVEIIQQNTSQISISDNAIFKLSNKNNTITINSLKGNAEIKSLNLNSTIQDGQNLDISGNKSNKYNSSITLTQGFIYNNNIHLEWKNDSDITDFIIYISDDSAFLKPQKIISTGSAIDVSWNKPVAYIKISYTNKSNKLFQSIPRKIYSTISEKEAPLEEKEKGIWKRMVDLFNKMLKNTSKLKKELP
jgi:hypothetical protein